MKTLHTRSAGGIVIGDGGMVAMVRRRDGDGSWLFPKGHIEPGEDDEKAARREIKEETGLEGLEYLDDLGSYTRPRITKEGGEDPYEMKEIHMFLFGAQRGAMPSVNEDFEIAEVLWVPFQRVAATIGNKTDRVWFAGVAERVREAIQRD